jgi:hypothetical protein
MATLAETHGEDSWFSPKNSESEASKVYAELCDASVGDVITYADLSLVLGRDFLDDRGPFYAARRKFEKLERGTFVVIRNTGVKYVADWDQVSKAGKQRHKRAQVQVRAEKRTTASADKTRMSNSEKADQINTLTRIGILESAMRSTKRQLQLVKKEVRVLRETKAEGTDLDAVKAELEALRQRLDAGATPVPAPEAPRGKSLTRE